MLLSLSPSVVVVAAAAVSESGRAKECFSSVGREGSNAPRGFPWLGGGCISMGRVGACSAVELVTMIERKQQRSIGYFVVRDVTGATWKTVICEENRGGSSMERVGNKKI